jgi:predicted DNA-binding transcriptional regulator AlpA
MNTAPKYLRRAEAAAYLKDKYGVGSRRTLDKLASVGGGPVYIKLGGAAVYDPADLDAWAQSRMTRFKATTVEADKLDAAA